MPYRQPLLSLVNLTEACRILGCRPSRYHRLAEQGLVPAMERGGIRRPRIPREEIEAAAARVYDWRRHLGDDDTYWITAEDIAPLVDLRPDQVEIALSGAGVPSVRHTDGTLLYRRAQVEIYASERQRRWSTGGSSRVTLSPADRMQAT